MSHHINLINYNWLNVPCLNSIPTYSLVGFPIPDIGVRRLAGGVVLGLALLLVGGGALLLPGRHHRLVLGLRHVLGLVVTRVWRGAT